MKSDLFYTDKYKVIQSKIKDYLNSQNDILSPLSIDSPRAVGDTIQGLLTTSFGTILGNLCNNYSSKFARRAMADLAFTDKNDNYYIIDVKTHRLDTSFNMPNLTSVERLARFYEDDKNYFVVLIIDYKINNKKIVVQKVIFVPIEFLKWSCLTLGALGWGQIQIANSNSIDIIEKNSRKKWMLELCDTLFEFYPKEIEKINSRILFFKDVQNYWKRKKE